MELPTIYYKGKTYTYDYKLNELRELTKKGIRFICLNNTENECLSYALSVKSNSLVLANMKELEWKM
jgi:hypothetical protein